MPGVTKTVEVRLPTMADMAQIEYVRPAEAYLGPKSGETIAWGMATYDAVTYQANHSQKMLAMQLAWDYEPGNAWVLPTMERLPYPYAIFYSLSSMFATEKQAGRKADWFFWLDDDVVVPRDVVRILRAAADPEERPFVAAVGYDRLWPHRPAVWKVIETGSNKMPLAVRFDPVPESGTHRVHTTGLCAAIFHRSLFDKVSEPWFAVAPPVYDIGGGHERGINPDTWWSEQMNNAGLPVYVCCDVEIIHLGKSIAVCRKTAGIMRELNRAGRAEAP